MAHFGIGRHVAKVSIADSPRLPELAKSAACLAVLSGRSLARRRKPLSRRRPKNSILLENFSGTSSRISGNWIANSNNNKLKTQQIKEIKHHEKSKNIIHSHSVGACGCARARRRGLSAAAGSALRGPRHGPMRGAIVELRPVCQRTSFPLPTISLAPVGLTIGQMPGSTSST